MTFIFADTGYYVALLLQTDQRHERAIEMTHELKASNTTKTPRRASNACRQC
jgi:predicted nucleic acid-binding protein